MGRTSKLTPEVQARVVEAIERGNYAEIAAQMAGIGRTTFYRWLDQGSREDIGPYRDFRDAVKEAEAKAETAVLQIIKDAMPDNWQAAAWYLERTRPGRYGKRQQIDVKQGDSQSEPTARERIEGRIAGLAARGRTDEVPGEPN